MASARVRKPLLVWSTWPSWTRPISSWAKATTAPNTIRVPNRATRARNERKRTSALPKRVAESAHGLDEARLAGPLQLLPQVADVDVDDVAGGVGAGSPDALQELVAAEDAARLAEEVLEQLEFLGGEIQGAAPSRYFPGVEVESQVAIGEQAGRPLGSPAEQRPHARHQLLVGEGLDQVVVGSAVEPLHARRGGIAGGQHQDRDIAFGTQPAADLDAIEAGHHPVQDHQVGRLLARLAQALGAVAGGVDVVALVDQRAAEGGGDPGVVVDNQDSRAVAHLAALILCARR